MLFKRSYVVCSNCGFLGWLTEAPDGSRGTDKLFECSPYARNSVQTGESDGQDRNPDTGESYKMDCLRQQWVLAPHLVKLSRKGLNYVGINTVRQPRQCPYYIKYQPGFGTEEHKEIKREVETHQAIRKASILAAVIGALIGATTSIIVQLISR